LHQRVGDCKPQELANAVWAIARLELKDWTLLEDLCSEAAERTPEMSSQHLANVSWALGRLSRPHDVWFRSVGEQMLNKDLTNFPVRHLVNITWGFARVGVVHSRFLEELGSSVANSNSLAKWGAQDLSGLAWSFASLEVVHASLFKRIGKEITENNRLETFGPQEMQNLIWAFAIMTRAGHLTEDVSDSLSLTASAVPRNRRASSAEMQRADNVMEKAAVTGTALPLRVVSTSCKDSMPRTTSSGITIDLLGDSQDSLESVALALEEVDEASCPQQNLVRQEVIVRSRSLESLLERLEVLLPREVDNSS